MSGHAPAEPVHRHATIAELGRHWIEWGEGAPVLMLHGNRSNAHSFDDLGPALAGGRRVLALDLRGHGESAWHPEARYRIADFASDVLAFLDHQGLERVALLGHSLGGVTALLFAAEHPERLTRLVVEDAGPPSERASRNIFARSARQPTGFKDPGEALAYLRGAGGLSAAAATRTLATGLRREHDWTLAYRADVAGMARSRASGDLLLTAAGQWPCVERRAMPTLVVRGGESAVLDADVAREMARRNPRIAVVEIEGAGHSVHADRPDEFLRAVDGFLGRG